MSDLFPLASTPLKRKGCLLTERHKWSLDNGIVVCLDKNTYLEAVDYELEIEYPQGQDELAYLEIQAVTDDLCSAGLMHSAGEIVGRLLWAKANPTFFDRYRKRRACRRLAVTDCEKRNCRGNQDPAKGRTDTGGSPKRESLSACAAGGKRK